jgi:hypothetical protein
MNIKSFYALFLQLRYVLRGKAEHAGGYADHEIDLPDGPIEVDVIPMTRGRSRRCRGRSPAKGLTSLRSP